MNQLMTILVIQALSFNRIIYRNYFAIYIYFFINILLLLMIVLFYFENDQIYMQSYWDGKQSVELFLNYIKSFHFKNLILSLVLNIF
jgi:hypothetical protein